MSLSARRFLAGSNPMIWLNKSIRIGCLVAGLYLISGCTEIRYVDHANSRRMQQVTEDPSALARKVDYHLSRAFYETPPQCVMIQPIRIKGVNPKTAQIVEDAVSRHASSRFDKTISARRVKFSSRKRAFDLSHSGDLRRLGRALRCQARLEIKTVGVENFYAVVWTDLSVALQLTLIRSRDGRVLWRGKHKARRADGGLPLTLIGASASTFSAGKLAGDRDILPSMIDDAVRRIMLSLPDTRRF